MWLILQKGLSRISVIHCIERKDKQLGYQFLTNNTLSEEKMILAYEDCLFDIVSYRSHSYRAVGEENVL
jgi:hypothetical protein